MNADVKQKPAYDVFWNFFRENLGFIESYQDNPETVVRAVGQVLNAVAPEIDFELGKNEKGYYELILIAGGMKSNIEPIMELYHSAPEIENWLIVPFRPRQEGSVFDLNGRRYDHNHVYYVSEVTPEGLTELWIYMQDFSPKNEKEIGGIGYLLLDSVLGEIDSMTMIGHVTFAALTDDVLKYPKIKPLSALAQEIDLRSDYNA